MGLLAEIDLTPIVTSLWWVFAVGIGTVGAAGFAAFAIVQAGIARREAVELSAKERQTQWYLTTLTRLVELNHCGVETPGRPQRMKALALTLPADLIPKTQEATGAIRPEVSKLTNTEGSNLLDSNENQIDEELIAVIRQLVDP